MDNVMMTVRAKFLTTPKSPGVPGVLMLNDNKFQWKSNDPNVASHLDVQFQAIKGLRANKENPKFKKALLNMGKDEEMKEGYLFEFNNFVDRDECRNLVAKILQKYQLEGGSKLPSEGQSKPSLAEPSFPSEQLNRKEMDRRMKLLSEDMELQKLHQQLVINGVISEADFWAARKTHDEDALKFQKQRLGLKSAMLTDVRPIHDGRTNKVTFNLTSDIIHQIFAEKPAVHRAFLSNVPSKMTEVEFWTKCCRADLIRRTHIQAAVAAEAEADEQLAIFLKDDDIIASETKKKIRKVDPTVDMTADIADDYLSLPGHGVFRDGSKENVVDDATQIKRMLVHDINRHATVVLDGRVLDVEGLRDTTTVAHALLAAKEGGMPRKEDEGTLMQKRSERVHEMTKVDDLEGPRAPPYVPLCIQDPRSYFDSQRPNVTEIGSLDAGTKLSSASILTHPDEVLSAFSQQCEELRAKISIDAAVVPDVAARVLNELTQYISNRKFQVGKTAEKNILNSLPRSTRDELLQLSAVSHELLRHFWAAHPLTSVAYKEKASRIKDALVDIHGKLQTLKQGAKPDYRHHLSQLLQPIIQALDAAFSCWENDEKRTVKGFQTVYSTNGVPAPG